jgi:hypothetical protein
MVAASRPGDILTVHGGILEVGPNRRSVKSNQGATKSVSAGFRGMIRGSLDIQMARTPSKGRA